MAAASTAPELAFLAQKQSNSQQVVIEAPSQEEVVQCVKENVACFFDAVRNGVIQGVDAVDAYSKQNQLETVDVAIFSVFLVVGLVMVFKGHKLKKFVLFTTGCISALCLCFTLKDVLPGFLARHQDWSLTIGNSFTIHLPDPNFEKENPHMLELLCGILGLLFGFILISFQKFGLAALGAALGCLASTIVNKYVVPKCLVALEIQEYHTVVTVSIFAIFILTSSFLLSKCFANFYAVIVPVVGAFVATNAIGVFARAYGPQKLFLAIKLPMDPFTKASSLEDIIDNWKQYMVETEKNITDKSRLEQMLQGSTNGYIILLALFALLVFMGCTMQFKEKGKKEREKGKITKTYGSTDI